MRIINSGVVFDQHTEMGGGGGGGGRDGMRYGFFLFSFF